MKLLIIFSSIFVTLSLEAAYKQDAPQGQGRNGLQSVMSAQAQQDRYTTPNDERLAYQIRRHISQISPQSKSVVMYIDRGDVRLMGRVPSEDIKRRIADAVQQVRGVKSVANRLDTTD
jgi:osmotically-inducible protein OsmY